MSKKILRKRLETSLVKLITETLTKKDAVATAKAKKTINDASRQIAKKFYKTVKNVSMKIPPKTSVKESRIKTAVVKRKTSRKK